MQAAVRFWAMIVRSNTHVLLLLCRLPARHHASTERVLLSSLAPVFMRSLPHTWIGCRLCSQIAEIKAWVSRDFLGAQPIEHHDRNIKFRVPKVSQSRENLVA